MKYLLGTVASVVTVLGGLASCVQIEDNGSTSGTEMAYLSFSPVTLDYSVEGILPTKAKVPSEDMPGSEDFTIRIGGQGIEDIVITPGNLTSDPIAVDAGSYTVEAYCGANGFAGPYFRKEVTVELAMGETRNIQLTDISLANAMVALVLPEGISQHLDVNSLQLTDGVTTIDVEPGQYVYAPSGKAVTAKFAGNNSLGEAKQISCSLGVLEPKHSYTVTCNLDLPNVSITLPDQQAGAWATRLYVTPAAVVSEISADKLVYEAIPASSSDWSSAKKSEVIEGAYHVIKGLTNGTSYKVRARLGAFCSEEKQVTVKAQFDGASISASHTYSGSVLTGSKATANIGFPSSGILRTLYDAGLLTINGCSLKYGDAQVRTLSGLSGEMTVVSGWPYLPKGTGYTFEVSHSCKGHSEEIKSSISSLEVEAPTFSVSASAYTSYDKYLERDLTFANNHDNKYTVFDVRASVTISDELLSNTRYSKTTSITLGGAKKAEFDKNSKTLGNITNCTERKNHQLVASVTFDGITNSASDDCHITGLPNSAAPPTNNGDWSGSVQDWKGDYVRLHKHTITQTFHVPSTINVSVVHRARQYTRADDCTYTFTVGATKHFENKQSSIGGKSKDINETYQAQLLTSSPTISASNSYGTIDALIEYTNVRIYEISVAYR